MNQYDPKVVAHCARLGSGAWGRHSKGSLYGFSRNLCPCGGGLPSAGGYCGWSQDEDGKGGP
jgi:hypothetical protein